MSRERDLTSPQNQQGILDTRFSRRDLLRLGGLGATAAFLAACGAQSSQTQEPKNPSIKPDPTSNGEVLGMSTEKPKLTIEFVATTTDQFFKDYLGKGLDFDGAYGNQCFDVPQELSKRLGGPRFKGDYAWQIYGQFPDFYQAIPYTSDLTVQKGDVFVWNNDFNKKGGHTGVSNGEQTTDENGNSTFMVFEQNDPYDPTGHSTCQIKPYGPNHMIGIMRPITIDTMAIGEVNGPGTSEIVVTPAPTEKPKNPIDALKSAFEEADKQGDFQRAGSALALIALLKSIDDNQIDQYGITFSNSKISNISSTDLADAMMTFLDQGSFPTELFVDFVYANYKLGYKINGEVDITNLQSTNKYTRGGGPPQGQAVDYWDMRTFEWDQKEHGLRQGFTAQTLNDWPSESQFKAWLKKNPDKSQYPDFSPKPYHMEAKILVSKVNGKWYTIFNEQPGDQYDSTQDLTNLFPKEMNEYSSEQIDISSVK